MTTDSHGPAASEASIRALVRAAVTHQGDVTRFLDLHTDDVVLVNLAGRRVIGKPALRQAMTDAMRTSLAQVTTDSEVLDITHLDQGTALVSCRKTITDESESAAPGPALPAAASLTYVVTDRDGPWRIALAQTTPIL